MTNGRTRKTVRLATAFERAVVTVCAQSVIDDLRSTLNRASSVVRRFKDDGDSDALVTAMESIRSVLPSTAEQLANVKQMLGFQAKFNRSRRPIGIVNANGAGRQRKQTKAC
jgi:hypothetical protein